MAANPRLETPTPAEPLTVATHLGVPDPKDPALSVVVHFADSALRVEASSEGDLHALTLRSPGDTRQQVVMYLNCEQMQMVEDTLACLRSSIQISERTWVSDLAEDR